MNLSCGNCGTIRPFSGDPPKCDVCGWECIPANTYDTPEWQNLRAQRREPVAKTSWNLGDVIDDDAADRIESAVGSVETAVEGLQASLTAVETAVHRVEAAIKNKWMTPQWIAVILVGIGLWSLPGDIWHAKWRYALSYGIKSSDVYLQDQPHDCAFFTAPLGTKYCHYEQTISVTRWATSQTGNPIVSYDDGKTWNTFDPAGKEVPKFSTVKEVYIGWEKKED